MKIFQLVFFATGKHISKVFLNSRHFCEFLLVFIFQINIAATRFIVILIFLLFSFST